MANKKIPIPEFLRNSHGGPNASVVKKELREFFDEAARIIQNERKPPVKAYMINHLRVCMHAELYKLREISQGNFECDLPKKKVNRKNDNGKQAQL